MRDVTVSELLDRHRVFLIDAYGVLVTSSGALPGAAEFLARLEDAGKPYFILTNDASRRPPAAADFYRRCGLEIAVERVLTSGLMIAPRLARLASAPVSCLVLGGTETRAYVTDAGHSLLHVDPFDLHAVDPPDAVVIGDDSGFEFMPTMNATLTLLHRQRQARPEIFPTLLLANADLIYPKGPQAYGFTSGAMSRLLELALAQLHPEEAHRLQFEILGKPSPDFFRLALARAGCRPEEAVMIGDQLHTDVQGANAAGIASAWFSAAEARLPSQLAPERHPVYRLSSLK